MKIRKFLSIFMIITLMVCMLSGVSLAGVNRNINNTAVQNLLANNTGSGDSGDSNYGDTISGMAIGIINTFLTVLAYVAWGVALGMLVYIGIKYMMAGAGEKAKVKETLLPYLIGALIVGSASTLAGLLIPEDARTIKVGAADEIVQKVIEIELG